MAFQPLSVGDILMLSQTAWKIGRAFTAGKNSAPAEFAEVERESNSLSEALKLVAETLHSNGSILDQADDDTKSAVNSILESAHKTLSDLESFVERYQVIKKKETTGGFVVERTWSEVVIANYKTFKWTTEGGDISELRDMLNVHTNSINLTMQALQSKSLARLEKMVLPMAENIASIHDRVNGDLGDKISDVHRFLMAIASGTPALVAKNGSVGSSSSRNSANTSSTSEYAVAPRMLEAGPRAPSYGSPSSPQQLPLRMSSKGSKHSSRSTVGVPPLRDSREDSAYYSPGPSRAIAVDKRQEYRRTLDWDFETGSPPDERYSIGAELDATAASPSDSAYVASEPPSRRESNIARRESTTLPNLFNAIDDAIAETEAGTYASSSRDPHGLHNSPTRSSQPWRLSSGAGPLLPPPALSHEGHENTPATPSSFFNGSKRSRTSNVPDLPSTRPQTAKSVSRRQSPNLAAATPSYSDGSKFERQLFRNAAILCDVRGRLVEYAQKNPDEPDPRFDVDMVPACQAARICVVRKRENREHVGTKIVTSIWALSDDGEVRLQQKLSEVHETVPYCSYFEPEKVSLQPTDGPQTSLKFHAKQWGGMLLDEKRTNWINYYFASENDAVAFQSAVFGRLLLGSYRTTKTTVLHEGLLKGTFAFEEQFANIEMLRLWEDDGVATPGAQGGVLALMHVSSNFGDGWARWWLNSSRQQVKVKDDGARHAKVKGINISVVRPGATAAAAAAAAAGGGSAAASPVSIGASTPVSPNLGAAAVGLGDGPPALQRIDTNVTLTAADLVPAQPLKAQRRVAVKRVHGVRIEFKTEDERARFVSTAKRAQERLLPLPDSA